MKLFDCIHTENPVLVVFLQDKSTDFHGNIEAYVMVLDLALKQLTRPN